ncbi:ribonuclease H-like [Ruditapes philippinarum]|uniref:ribonuclease H-like n=1 Tax=Ruditapes philippinarum TaxID=129788 RepID=UPI00295C134C|nr:ribonuclease H-like [Ruditapes philippinarum]
MMSPKKHSHSMIADEYPQESWTHIYTDGSATAAIKDGGAGIYIQHTNSRSDTISALEHHQLPELSEVLSRMSQTRQIALQWIPAHCGIPGNEKADELAKLGAEGDQPMNHISYKEKTTTIKAAMRWQSNKDDYHYLDRREQVTIFRLRTGHNRLNICTKLN